MLQLFQIPDDYPMHCKQMNSEMKQQLATFQIVHFIKILLSTRQIYVIKLVIISHPFILKDNRFGYQLIFNLLGSDISDFWNSF